MTLNISLGLRLASRQWRAAVVRMYIIAVTIACAVTLSIALLGDRFEKRFVAQSKHLLAADLVLESTTEVTQEQWEIISDANLELAQTLTFATMAGSKDRFLLASVKAVSADYPLRGELQVAPALFSKAAPTSHGPERNSVWVEDRVLLELGIEVGDYVSIGERQFRIDQLLVFEPDRGGQFYSFTPRIMMHIDDLADTGVIQPGSRMSYRYLLAGDDQKLQGVQRRLAKGLQPNQKFVTIESSNQALSTTLQRAYRFLYVAALVAIILGAVATALVSYKYAHDMTYHYALMRCLGMSRIQLRAAIWIPFAVFTLIATVLGLIVGYWLHGLLLDGLGHLVTGELPPAGAGPYLLGSIGAIGVAVGFAWPFLNQLHNTPAQILLRQWQGRRPVFYKALVSMSLGLTLLVFVATGDWVISLGMVMLVALLCSLFYFLLLGAIKWLLRVRHSYSVVTGMSLRLLQVNRHWIAMQISAIALTLFSIVFILTVSQDLIRSWQAKVPEDAPNYFVINLFGHEKALFEEKLQELDVDKNPLYPIVRGRLSSVNGIPIREYASKETDRSDESLNRDLALTYSLELPKDNRIIYGQWHETGSDADIHTVSVEQGVAENLDILPGDMLEFTIESRKISARVSSIRSVEWESFTPNFYMIFYPGALEGLPVTYLTSFYLSEKQRSAVPDLIKAFPTATFFDVGFLLKTIQSIAGQVAFTVNLLLYFALFAALVVFVTIELILYQSRVQTTAIFKALGASNDVLLKIYGLQFVWAGLLAGCVAFLLNLCISLALNSYIVEGGIVFNPLSILICLLLAPLLVTVTGLISVRKTKHISALRLLAQV